VFRTAETELDSLGERRRAGRRLMTCQHPNDAEFKSAQMWVAGYDAAMKRGKGLSGRTTTTEPEPTVSVEKETSGTIDQETVHRMCPACGDDSGRPAGAVRAPISPLSLDPEERAAYWRGFRKKSCFFDYVRCPNCGLLYCSTYFSASALDRLYSSMPDNTAGAPADLLRHTQKGYIDFLGRQRPILQFAARISRSGPISVSLPKQPARVATWIASCLSSPILLFTNSSAKPPAR
jgi:hypothetical protein